MKNKKPGQTHQYIMPISAGISLVIVGAIAVAIMMSGSKVQLEVVKREPWRYTGLTDGPRIAKDGETIGSFVATDMETIEKSGTTRVFWSAWVNPDAPGDAFGYEVKKMRIDCKTLTVTMLGFVEYDMEREIVRKDSVGTPTELIVPNTLMDRQRKQVCDNKHPKNVKAIGWTSPIEFAKVVLNGDQSLTIASPTDR